MSQCFLPGLWWSSSRSPRQTDGPTLLDRECSQTVGAAHRCRPYITPRKDRSAPTRRRSHGQAPLLAQGSKRTGGPPESVTYYSSVQNKGPLGSTHRSKHTRRHVFARRSTLGRSRGRRQGEVTIRKVERWLRVWRRQRRAMFFRCEWLEECFLTAFRTHSHPWTRPEGLSHCQVLTHCMFVLSTRTLGSPNTNKCRRSGEDKRPWLRALPSLQGFLAARKTLICIRRISTKGGRYLGPY